MVPVYSGSFGNRDRSGIFGTRQSIIVQDVMLDPSRDGSLALKDVTTLTITGTFEYQACDDNVCFAPQSLPLSWTIAVNALDRQRATRP